MINVLRILGPGGRFDTTGSVFKQSSDAAAQAIMCGRATIFFSIRDGAFFSSLAIASPCRPLRVTVQGKRGAVLERNFWAGQLRVVQSPADTKGTFVPKEAKGGIDV